MRHWAAKGAFQSSLTKWPACCGANVLHVPDGISGQDSHPDLAILAIAQFGAGHAPVRPLAGQGDPHILFAGLGHRHQDGLAIGQQIEQQVVAGQLGLLHRQFAGVHHDVIREKVRQHGKTARSFHSQGSRTTAPLGLENRFPGLECHRKAGADPSCALNSTSAAPRPSLLWTMPNLERVALAAPMAGASTPRKTAPWGASESQTSNPRAPGRRATTMLRSSGLHPLWKRCVSPPSATSVHPTRPAAPRLVSGAKDDALQSNNRTAIPDRFLADGPLGTSPTRAFAETEHIGPEPGLRLRATEICEPALGTLFRL